MGAPPVRRDDDASGVHGPERRDELAGGQGLGEVAGGALPDQVAGQPGLEVPGVDDDLADAGVGEEPGDASACLADRDGVVEDDVGTRGGQVDELAVVAVGLQHRGDAADDDLVGVDESNSQHHRSGVPLLG